MKDKTFERILARFIDHVQCQEEPVCYGRATNTSVVGFIDQEGAIKVDIYTNENAGKAVFKASYNQNVFDPYHPYWDIFQKVGDGNYYDENNWLYKGTVDDTETAEFYEDA
ncbi:MAG: hypothetical protein ACOX8A_11685 [Thermacetogeniaceae bacterium]|jgi:hypothetical protein